MPFPKVFRMATLMMLVSAAIVVTWSGLSAAATPGAPQVLSAYATPSALGPSGGTVTVTGRVKNARTCQLEVLSRQSFPVVYSHNPTSACQNGAFSAHVLIGANPSPVKRTVAFALFARDGSLSSTGLFYVSVGPFLAPSVLSAYATPSALGPSGGTVTVTGRVKNARTCQLEVLSRQSFPVVYSHNPTSACQNGAFSAHVLIGANPSPVKRTVAFALLARDGSLSSTGLFYVSAGAVPGALGPVCLCHPERPRPERGHRDRDGQGEERPHLPARGAFAPVVPRGVLAQPDQRLPERGLLGSCPDRGQPEPGQAHRGFRPVGARRAACRPPGSSTYPWRCGPPTSLLPRRHLRPRCRTGTRRGQPGTTFPGPSARRQVLLSQNHCPTRRPLPSLA